MAFFGATPQTSSSFNTSTQTGAGFFGTAPSISNTPLYQSAPETPTTPLFGTAADTGTGFSGDIPEFGLSSFVEAKTELLDFEGIVSTTDGRIPDGYGGLDWNENSYILAPLSMGYESTGYATALQSGDYVAFNAWGSMMSFTTAGDETFGLASGFFASAWEETHSVTIEARRDGNIVGTAELILNRTQAAEVDFINQTVDENAIALFEGQFNNVDEVIITSNGTQVAMDDLVIIGSDVGSISGPEVGSNFFGF